jgi:ZIP family zinc transporter
MALFLWGDHLTNRLSQNAKRSPREQAALMAFAVTLHNLPEGMAVGVVFASALANQQSPAPALALSLGIALQNFPEEAIISLPLAGVGMKRSKAFLYGMLSGVVEPLGAIAALLFAEVLSPLLPFILSFAAGAMLYVTVQELIPQLSRGKENQEGAMSLATGFCLMMALDVLLG